MTVFGYDGMKHYILLSTREERSGVGWPFAASLVLHAGLIAILASSTVFYPPTGNVERFNFIWVSTDSIPGEPTNSLGPSMEQEKPALAAVLKTEIKPPNRDEAIAPLESSQADDVDSSSADDQSEPEVSMVTASKSWGKKLKYIPLPVTEPARKIVADARTDAAGLVEARRLLQEKVERDRLAAEMARMQRLVADKAAREQAELQRIAQEKTERESAMAFKLEQERQAREWAEQQKIVAENAEIERLAAERAAAEKAEAERLAADRASREKAERDRLAREKAARNRLAAALAEENRLAKQRAELERLAALKAEQERIAAARAAAAKDERLATERAAEEKAERARLAQEKAERERVAALKAEQERINRTKAAASIKSEQTKVVATARTEAPAPSVTTTSHIQSAKSAASPGEKGNQLEQEKNRSIPIPSSSKKLKADVSPEVSLMLATVYGDLKLVVAGTDQLKYRAVFKAFPRHRRDRPMTKSESTREQKVVSLILRTVDNSTEVIIKSTLEGIYALIAEPDEGESVTTNFSLRLYEATSQAKTKSLGKKTVFGKTIVARVLMPEGILWDDEEAFTGSIENSDSVTKFNSETGLIWKEYR
ncbi:hypothetical protein ANAEL_04518 [Anaerolineales bacterium]|nr:hypothetical protein ANAEL_04518 [Anaerolineales bacterium]